MVRTQILIRQHSVPYLRMLFPSDLLLFVYCYKMYCFPCGSAGSLPAMWGTWVQSLGWEDPLEEVMAIHSSILAWRIPMDKRAWGHKKSEMIE